MRTKKFWIDALERAASTAAQAAIAMIGMDQFNAIQADWKAIAGTALGAAILSILKAMAASRVGSHENASLIQ